MLTYFRERKLTIIGAVKFHGPVREGKGWFQDAMGTRLKRGDLGLRQVTEWEEVGMGSDWRLLHLGIFCHDIPKLGVVVLKVIGSSRTGN